MLPLLTLAVVTLPLLTLADTDEVLVLTFALELLDATLVLLPEIPPRVATVPANPLATSRELKLFAVTPAPRDASAVLLGFSAPLGPSPRLVVSPLGVEMMGGSTGVLDPARVVFGGGVAVLLIRVSVSVDVELLPPLTPKHANTMHSCIVKHKHNALVFS